MPKRRPVERNNPKPVEYTVKRKTNDTALKAGDTVYDRDGGRYKFVSHTLLGLISAVRILARPKAGDVPQPMTADADWFGVYFDPPHPNTNKKSVVANNKLMAQREMLYQHWSSDLRKADEGIGGTTALTLEEYDELMFKVEQQKRRDRDKSNAKEKQANAEAAAAAKVDREALLAHVARTKSKPKNPK